MSRRWLTAAVPLVLVGALAGCSSADDEAVAAPEPSVLYSAGDTPVLEPGSPGEPAEVVPPGATSDIANPGAYGEVDVAFVTDMVPHHTQALRMAELVPERSSDERVRAIAERIEASQGPEIATMQAWLSANGLPPADEESDHTAHQDMPGMTTDEQMLQLVAAEDEDFDRMFLELMTAHHEGALQMADLAAGAANPVVSEMVNDVAVTQTVEIQRMQEILADL